MTDTNGQPPAVGTAEDHAELALVGRITTLEQRSAGIEEAIGLLCLAVMAGAVAGLVGLLLLKRKGMLT